MGLIDITPLGSTCRVEIDEHGRLFRDGVEVDEEALERAEALAELARERRAFAEWIAGMTVLDVDVIAADLERAVEA